MRFRIASLDVRLSRNTAGRRTQKDTADELDANRAADAANIVRDLDFLPPTGRIDLLARVSITPDDFVGNSREARANLGAHGITVVPDFIDPQKAKAVASWVLNSVTQIRQGEQSSPSLSGLHLETSGSKNYGQLASAPHATAVFRTGVDDGMVDVFNFDLWNHEYGAWLREALSSSAVEDLIRKRSDGAASLSPANLNVYVNQGVSKTRGFHVDTYGGRQVKAFLYLTDVVDLEDGPYTYVLGSHKKSTYQDANQALAQCNAVFKSTDTPLVDRDMAMPVLAPAGSLVVSDQSGSHRGYPQASGRQRVVAVLNYVG